MSDMHVTMIGGFPPTRRLNASSGAQISQNHRSW
jgi:hypothetical protein